MRKRILAELSLLPIALMPITVLALAMFSPWTFLALIVGFAVGVVLEALLVD